MHAALFTRLTSNFHLMFGFGQFYLMDLLLATHSHGSLALPCFQLTHTIWFYNSGRNNGHLEKSNFVHSLSWEPILEMNKSKLRKRRKRVLQACDQGFLSGSPCSCMEHRKRNSGEVATGTTSGTNYTTIRRKRGGN